MDSSIREKYRRVLGNLLNMVDSDYASRDKMTITFTTVSNLQFAEQALPIHAHTLTAEKSEAIEDCVHLTGASYSTVLSAVEKDAGARRLASPISSPSSQQAHISCPHGISPRR
jgi:hypothetical protein